MTLEVYFEKFGYVTPTIVKICGDDLTVTLEINNHEVKQIVNSIKDSISALFSRFKVEEVLYLVTDAELFEQISSRTLQSTKTLKSMFEEALGKKIELLDY